MNLPEAERERRLRSIANQDEAYDPEERLIKKWLGEAYSYNWYARNTFAHPTRDSLSYAVALLDTYDDSRIDRASDVISRIIEIQEDDPEHQHFGVWPHLMEEPLGKGPYVDRNWADFLGKDLLHVMIYHADRIAADLLKNVEASLRRACEAIRIRDVRPGYTNISIMGSYVTTVSGETLGDEAILGRGIERLSGLHDHVQDNGTFTEYNSPTYTMVALRDLATFRHHVRHPETKSKVDNLFRLSWEILANHFHPTTRQWAGPNSRSYNSLQGGNDRNAGLLRTIEQWTGPAVDFDLNTLPQDPAWAAMDARCPTDLEPLLVSVDAPRNIRETVVKRDPLPHIATTWVTRELALGSINHQDTWNQRRNVLAYWGTTGAPSCLKVRLIYDGYDLSTGALWTRQDRHRLLGTLTFATNGGGKHLSLEKLENGTFEAEELALRFEFSGSASSAAVAAPSAIGEPARVSHQDLDIGIHVPFATFDGCDIRWESIASDEGACLDLTFHRGEKRTFVLPEIDRAAGVFALDFGGTGDFASVDAAESDGTISASWDDMALTVPVKPDTYDAMRAAATGLA